MMTFAARCASWLLECRLAQGCWCYVVRWLGEPAKSSGSWDFRVGMRSAMFLCFVLTLPSGLFVEVSPKIQGPQRETEQGWSRGQPLDNGPMADRVLAERHAITGGTGYVGHNH
jgi:hypothetical protein